MRTPIIWGDLIRQLRTEHGLGLRTLAARSGLCRTTVRRAETGKDVTVRTLERLLDFYGYDLDAIKRKDSGDAL